jgi:hypothetical protein
MSERKTLKLQITLVPTPLCKRSLYHVLPKNQWRKLRADKLAAHGLVCDTCGKKDDDGRFFHAHEIWNCEEEIKVTAVARLTGIGIVCRTCHAVMHFENATRISLAYRKCPLHPDAYSIFTFKTVDGEHAIVCSECRAVLPDPLDVVRAHFCEVNDVFLDEFHRHFAEASAHWSGRNELEWTVDWGAFAPMVEAAEAKRSARTHKKAGVP